jgi:GNAT superfamily N-acetyltransferase
MKYIKLFEEFVKEGSSEETYTDYPTKASDNAKLAIEWKEKYGREEVEAGTAVGWARAHQLANKEPLSADTVMRMASFNRHRKNSKIDPEFKDTPWKDKGYVAWLIWGGDEGVDWALDKAEEIRSKTGKVAEAFVMRNLEDEYGIELDLYDTGKYLELSKIVVPKKSRGEGIGTELMQKIVDFADQTGKDVRLTPSTSFGATSTDRLKKFYKRFGFVKNDDYAFRDTMVRYHK